MALSNFGEQFAAKTLRKFYQTAITPAITNTNYEGDIKKAGDRVNILSFLSDITLSDYTAGSDMSTESIVDSEDVLVVAKRKYYNFPIDKLEDLFTYADDINDTLVENANKVLERTVDTYVLEQASSDTMAGNWIGIDVRVAGATGTHASIATSATGGTLNVEAQNYATAGNIGWQEIGSGDVINAGFQTADVDKPIRLTSGTTWATGWYRISAVTDSNTCSLVNWDGATSGSDIPNGDILRELGGAVEFTGGATNTDGKCTTEGSAEAAGWGWEFQAGRATALTASNIYEAITLAAEKLDNNEIPDSDRSIVVPPMVMTMLRQASELQPAISMAYEGVVLNGKVGRVGGFDIYQAAGVRVSTRLEKSTMSTDKALTNGGRAYMIPCWHKSFCTFAYKWAESRVVDAESQFAKKYQGLHLFGAKVPALRRKGGAVIFGAV